MVKSDDAEPEGLGPDHMPLWSRESDSPNAPVAISSLYMGGPYRGSGAARFAEPAADLRVPSRAAPRRKLPARRRFCRDWRGVRIAGPRPTTTCRRCSVSTSAAGPTEISTRGFARRSSACWSVPIFCSASRPIRREPLRGPSIVFPMSSWLRACRSPCGAAFRTTLLLDLAIRREIERAGGARKTGCAHAGRPARA